MKCPRCQVELVPTTRYKLTVNACGRCKGMWFERPELGALEDEVFDFGDRWKGTLVFESSATPDPCPECATPLQRFRYRFYDLEMELCPKQHGYWLEADEDTRVLEVMRREETDLQRKLLAENQWGAMLRHLHSHSFLERIRDLFQR